MDSKVTHEICRICRKPKSDGAVSSITQWLAFCQCNVLKPADDASSNTRLRCSSCGKFIAREQAGSLTQWIFSGNSCLCKNPLPASSAAQPPADRKKMPAFNFDEPLESAEMEVEPENFPVDRYSPVRLLGKGNIGEVYLCVDRALKKAVAIKCLFRVTDDRAVAFQTEAKIASKLHHSGVIEILDFGVTSGGRPFMVMEHFEGISLEKLLAEAHSLSEEVVINLFIKICDGLQYMHEHGVYHRDLKPSNVLIAIDESGAAAIKIIDFGLAKTTQDIQSKTILHGKTIVGTPAYMSPDQVSGQTYNDASEIYSLGCMMFEALCGSPPFSGKTALETLNQQINEELAKASDLVPDVSRHLESIIERCLCKSNAERYQSVSELLDALHAWQDEQSDSGAERHVAGVKHKWPNKTMSVTVSLLLALLFSFSFSIYKILSDEGPKTPITAGRVKDSFVERSASTFEALDEHGNNIIEHVGLLYVQGTPATNILKHAVDVRRKVRRVVMDGGSITEEDAKLIEQLSPLSVSFSNTKGVNEKTLKILFDVRSIITFRLAGIRVAPKSLEHLCNLPQLRMLVLSDCNLTNDHLMALSQCKNPIEFDLRFNKNLTMEGLQYLSGRQHCTRVIANAGMLAVVPGAKRAQILADWNIDLVKDDPNIDSTKTEVTKFMDSVDTTLDKKSIREDSDD